MRSTGNKRCGVEEAGGRLRALLVHGDQLVAWEDGCVGVSRVALVPPVRVHHVHRSHDVRGFRGSVVPFRGNREADRAPDRLPRHALVARDELGHAMRRGARLGGHERELAPRVVAAAARGEARDTECLKLLEALHGVVLGQLSAKHGGVGTSSAPRRGESRFGDAGGQGRACPRRLASPEGVRKSPRGSVSGPERRERRSRTFRRRRGRWHARPESAGQAVRGTARGGKGRRTRGRAQPGAGAGGEARAAGAGRGAGGGGARRAHVCEALFGVGVEIAALALWAKRRVRQERARSGVRA